MMVVGELTAGTVPAKTEGACRTCGATLPLTPGGFCFNPRECDARRIARVSKTQHLRQPCLVRLRRLGATYYLREFGPKIAPPPPVLPPGFTVDDYSDRGRRYYEAVHELGQATSFSVRDALALAKMFNGEVTNK